MNAVAVNKKEYKVQLRNIGLEGYEYDALLAETTCRTAQIHNAVSRLNYREILENHGIELGDCIVGCIIEHYNNRAIVGHEGDDWIGNIKTVEQFEITWEEIAK